LALYLVVGIAGYWSLGNNTPDLVIKRTPIPGSNDIMMTIAKVGFTINLSFCLPLNISPERL